jgi:hypothetical protein
LSKNTKASGSLGSDNETVATMSAKPASAAMRQRG